MKIFSLNSEKVLFDGPMSDLRGANLFGANLRGTNLFGANLRGANLCGANLCGANLTGANLINVNLRGADLFGASLRGADLFGASLRSANLHCADLRGADLHCADLRGADLTGASLFGANLTGANLTNTILTNTNLTGVNRAWTDPDVKAERVAKSKRIKFKDLPEGQLFAIENIAFRRGNDLNGYGQCCRLADQMQVHPIPCDVEPLTVKQAIRLVEAQMGVHLTQPDPWCASVQWNYRPYLTEIERKARKRTARKRTKR